MFDLAERLQQDTHPASQGNDFWPYRIGLYTFYHTFFSE
jgi:hypothetical protein